MTTRAPALAARAAMLIRACADTVFDAFADPSITTRFWFTDSTGALAPGARVRWTWSMYGVHADVAVIECVRGQRLHIAWGDAAAATRVEWTFETRGDATFVEIAEHGFTGDRDAQVAAALDYAGGFALVLAGCKAWLEHGIELNLVMDRHPDHRRD